MGRVIVWLIIILFLLLVGGFIYFGFSSQPVQQTTIEQSVEPEALGL